MPYLVQYDGEKLVAEAATASEAIQAGEKAEPEGRNAVGIIAPSGQSFSVSEYKVIVAGDRSDPLADLRAETPCRCRRQRRPRRARV